MFGVPVRAAINSGPSRPGQPARHRFSVSADGMVGYGTMTDGGTALGWQAGLGLGCELM